MRPAPISPDAAAALVKSGDWVDYGFGMGQPDRFDRALAARAAELRDVKIRAALTMRPRAVLDADPHAEHFLWFNWHFSGYDRAQHDADRCNYIPMNFGEAPDYYRRFIDPIDVVCIKTCPMDAQGFFNFGGAVTYQKAVTERAKVLIVETCEAMPYVYGEQESVHAREVDYVIDGGAGSVPEVPHPTVTEVDRRAAERIAAATHDGPCPQTATRATPNAARTP